MSDSEHLVIEPIGRCRLRRTRRRTLAISVSPDGSVELTAPQASSLEAIRQKVLTRRKWIRRQQQAFAQMNGNRQALRYCSGATHRYLGRQYRLKVLLGTTPSVKLLGGYIRVQTPHPTDENLVRKQLEEWYLSHAKPIFERNLAHCLPKLQSKLRARPQLKLLMMKKRWGSCTSSGKILLNPDLVKAPSICIDYVILHELCHLLHPNHGKNFQQLLQVVMPNWLVHKQRLERIDLA